MTAELDQSRRYLKPVPRLPLPGEPDVTHLAVYTWEPKFEEWVAYGTALCGRSAEQGDLPMDAEVTCPGCLDYRPGYQTSLDRQEAAKAHSATRDEQRSAAEKRLQAITEAVVLWRDRPGGDVGLAIALANILDIEQPEPPAAAALVRVLRECDRIERAVRANPKSPDFDGAYLACLGHIRTAAGPIPPDLAKTGCAECDHPEDQHVEADEPVSVGQCLQCAEQDDDESWHDYQPMAAQ